MKNLLKLSTFVVLLCSFVFSTTSIVSADEKKAETATDSEKTKDGDDKTKGSEGGDKKKKKNDEEPDCD